MARKYSKVLALLQSKPDGTVQVNDPELIKLLGTAPGADVAYRTACYISDIRRYAKLDVRGIREGRKVIAYQLVALTPEDAPAQEANPTASV